MYEKYLYVNYYYTPSVFLLFALLQVHYPYMTCFLHQQDHFCNWFDTLNYDFSMHLTSTIRQIYSSVIFAKAVISFFKYIVHPCWITAEWDFGRPPAIV